jgi:hypothetical protein
VIGFNGSSDLIALNNYAAAPVITAVGGSTLLGLSDGTTVLLQGVASVAGASFVA